MSFLYWWHALPFARYVVCLAAGICLQWYYHFDPGNILRVSVFFLLCLILYEFLPLIKKFQYGFISGILCCLLVVCLGLFLVWHHDIRNQSSWFGHSYQAEQTIVVRINEPPVEKTNSFKTTADIEALHDNNQWKKQHGNIILYFEKGATLPDYGDQMIINKPLQEIRNSGNPGSFDYKTYCLFQGITHQVYLRRSDWMLLPGKKENSFYSVIIKSRNLVISVIRKFVSGERETGLAEALLIGYKDDLDKTLVEAYSNTGVVHVIAISGLHLGLVYWLLLILTKPLSKRSFSWVRFFIIVSALWMFSIIAGAQPSVLRSAVMFSFMALGNVIGRKTSVYNSLGLSAFLLLCYQPFWLWDAGFQLSYAAVLSLIVFFQPVYRWLYFPNKLMDMIWKLNAVTIAAQLLALPVSLYHFHQIPVLFLLTNMVAVPLSSIILFGEIFLCVIAVQATAATWTGNILSKLIALMNSYIEQMNRVSFSVWDGILISPFQAFLLLACIVLFFFWLMEKKTAVLWCFSIALMGFVALRTESFLKASMQKKLIIYQIPKNTGMDLVDGRNVWFMGDSICLNDHFVKTQCLRPSRIVHRAGCTSALPIFSSFIFQGKTIIRADSSIDLSRISSSDTVHLLIFSASVRQRPKHLANPGIVQQVVIEGNVPAWKAGNWRRDCDSLRLPCHDVNTQGAFIMNL